MTRYRFEAFRDVAGCNMAHLKLWKQVNHNGTQLWLAVSQLAVHPGALSDEIASFFKCNYSKVNEQFDNYSEVIGALGIIRRCAIIALSPAAAKLVNDWAMQAGQEIYNTDMDAAIAAPSSREDTCAEELQEQSKRSYSKRDYSKRDASCSVM